MKEVSNIVTAAMDKEEQNSGSKNPAGRLFIFFCISQEIATGLFGNFWYVCLISLDPSQI